MPSQGCLSSKRTPSLSAACFPAIVWGLITGCASPGAPRPPSLQLPQPVRDLTATRSGDQVELRFTVPSRTTENLPLRSGPLHATLCRQLVGGPCQPVSLPEAAVALPVPRQGAPEASLLWADPLPHDLASGRARPISYRLDLRNDEGHSAGYCAPAYTAAGAAPPLVEAFEAQGVRSGVLLRWTPQRGGGEVLLERTQLDTPPAASQKTAGHTVALPSKGSSATVSLPGRKAKGKGAKGDKTTVWLQAEPGNTAGAETIDGTVTEGVRYRYLAVRRIVAQAGGRSLELRSAPSIPVEITWHDVYPPPMPGGLTALGFGASASESQAGSAAYAVDLIWQPVSDLRVTGYLVTRATLSPTGAAQDAPQLLTPQPVTTPALHDTTALRTQSYRYAVTAVDAKGNGSAPAETIVPAQQK